jgi:hypothetical protein
LDFFEKNFKKKFLSEKHGKMKGKKSGNFQLPLLYFSVNVKPILSLSNEIQSFVSRIDHYADSLEGILAQRIGELNCAKGQLDGLLQQLLPL